MYDMYVSRSFSRLFPPEYYLSGRGGYRYIHTYIHIRMYIYHSYMYVTSDVIWTLLDSSLARPTNFKDSGPSDARLDGYGRALGLRFTESFALNHFQTFVTFCDAKRLAASEWNAHWSQDTHEKETPKACPETLPVLYSNSIVNLLILVHQPMP